LHGSHNGKYFAEIFIATVKQYAIERNIGYITCDNHRVNDTMCKAISEALSSMDPPTGWDPLEHRIRCNGHVINLAVQAFLFAKDKDAVSVAIEASQSSLGRVDVDVDVDDALAIFRVIVTPSGLK
ncbi:hypothetical protein LTR16_009718, partial [Cryomyces antarcticus]